MLVGQRLKHGEDGSGADAGADQKDRRRRRTEDKSAAGGGDLELVADP
jgi:hypothetical protein